MNKLVGLAALFLVFATPAHAYDSFTILVKDPATFKQALVDQGIVTLDKNGVPVPTRQGVEYVEVPNIIKGDTRHAYLVKFSGDADADQKDGIDQKNPDTSLKDKYAGTKLGTWVTTQGTETTVDGLQAYAVGTDFTIVIDDTGHFGVWQ